MNSRKLIQKSLYAVIAIAGMSFGLHAEEITMDKFSLGVEYGKLYPTNDEETISASKKENAVWLTALYQTAPHVRVGLENGYLLGQKLSETQSDGVSVASAELKHSGIYLGPVIQLETAPSRFSLYGRMGAGVLFSKTEASASYSDSFLSFSSRVKDTTANPTLTLAVGGDFHLTKQLSLGLGVRNMLIFEKQLTSSINDIDNSVTIETKQKPRHVLMPFVTLALKF